MAEKKPFDLDLVMNRLQDAVRPFPPAALFQLADEGYTSAFEQLVACMISIRTRDETTLPAARRFFRVARTPAQVSALSVEEIDALIGSSSFHTAKADQIHRIARQAVEQYDGVVPCDFVQLTSFDGVGPKCANLVLGIACSQPRIGVDIHVHRVTNRWGYVQTRTPEATLAVLERILPHQYWLEINRVGMPFGKFICTGAQPHCSRCPVLEMCLQVGVTAHR